MFNTRLDTEVQLLSPPSNGIIHYEIWKKKEWFDDDFVMKVDINLAGLSLGAQDLNLLAELSVDKTSGKAEKAAAKPEKALSKSDKSQKSEKAGKVKSFKIRVAKKSKDSRDSKEKPSILFIVTLKGDSDSSTRLCCFALIFAMLPVFFVVSSFLQYFSFFRAIYVRM